MPFPEHLIRNWKQHAVVIDPTPRCTRCGLTHIPENVIHPDGVVFEKDDRFLLGYPQKWAPCEVPHEG